MGLATLERSVERNYNGLEPAEHALVTREQRDFLERLGSFEAPYLEEKLLSEGVFDSSEEYQRAFTEFKRYAALNEMGNSPLGMSSKRVDEVWHQFILFTPHYQAFCDDVLGEFMHHVPNTSHTGNPEVTEGSFVRAYQEVFGEIPEIWDLERGLLHSGKLGKIESTCSGCSSSGCSPCSTF